MGFKAAAPKAGGPGPSLASGSAEMLVAERKVCGTRQSNNKLALTSSSSKS